MKDSILYIIIPCYNEEAVLPFSSSLFLNKLLQLITIHKVSENSRILYVDNASEDNTWDIIKSLVDKDSHILAMKQSRNFGHQANVLAGLMESKNKADMIISVDCDGQDDIDAIEEMVDKYHEGYDIVYGVRDNRSTDSFLKRISSQMFYRFLKALGANIVYNHADYRLTSSRILNEFSQYEEVNLYLRGLFPLVGFRSTCVYYNRHERLAGKSHYSIRHLFSLAFDGITSLSTQPLHLISGIGAMVVLASFCGIAWAILSYIHNKIVSGWASLICAILFIGGIQLISIGIIGEYVGKIYLETKHRPRYIIEQKYGNWTD